jgi:hypothetical protein
VDQEATDEDKVKDTTMGNISTATGNKNELGGAPEKENESATLVENNDSNNQLQTEVVSKKTNDKLIYHEHTNHDRCANKGNVHEWKSLKPYDHVGYCRPGNRFHGVSCNECKILFVVHKPVPGKCVKPSAAKPIHCCPNEKENCNFALCHECYLAAVLKDA